jgi:predicted NACHT family NTPase
MKSGGNKDLFRPDSLENLKESLYRHAEQVSHWASLVQISGMPRPVLIENTIPLHLNEVEKSINLKLVEGVSVSEESLLEGEGAILILGNPGCGKTTLVKRLANLVLKRSERDKDFYQAVILLRMSNVREYSSIFELITQALGVASKNNSKDKSEKTLSHISELRILLLIDGVDVLSPSEMSKLLDEASCFSDSMSNAKVIVTCRTGSFISSWPKGSILEVLPLDEHQVEQYTQRYLGESHAFISALKASSVYDFATTPLNLMVLINAYSRIGYLPNRNADLYKYLVRLYVEEWDEQRAIVRKGSFVTKSPEEIVEVLSIVAFSMSAHGLHIARVDEIFRLSQQGLRFLSLDKEDFSLALEEITQSTGILRNEGDGLFAFSHLSLQEYLCANYMVRLPQLPAISLLSKMAGPLAIATTISSNPMLYLVHVIEHLANAEGFEGRALFVASFFNRVLVEFPGLKPEEFYIKNRDVFSGNAQKILDKQLSLTKT